MSITHVEPAVGLTRLFDSSVRVRYSSTSISGQPTTMTGVIHLPTAKPPEQGWPVIAYGHMTTGVGWSSAPSLMGVDHPERRRATQSDGVIRRLVAGGAAVLCPDYEGLGSPGSHPYLIGPSLSTSMIDMVAAAQQWDPRLGHRWAAAGHSEGAVAAAYVVGGWTAFGHTSQRPPSTVQPGLIATAMVSPVTAVHRTIGLSLKVPVPVRGFVEVPALTAMMIYGLGTVDPDLNRLVAGDGLSPRAKELWPDLERLSLAELATPHSLGGLAGSALLGPSGKELVTRLLAGLRAADIANLEMPRDLPIRIDSAYFDEVQPWWLTTRLAHRWRRAGADVHHTRWRAGHSTVLDERHAPNSISDWLLSAFA